MPACAVATCKVWSGGWSNKKTEASFFRFPKNPEVQAAWVHRCYRQDQFNVKNAVVCSEHFVETDYDPSYLVKRTLMPNVKPSLKPDAIPSRNLPSASSLSRCVFIKC